MLMKLCQFKMIVHDFLKNIKPISVVKDINTQGKWFNLTMNGLNMAKVKWYILRVTFFNITMDIGTMTNLMEKVF